MKYLLMLLMVLLLVCVGKVKMNLQSCQASELTYIYTDCDKNNGRWSVQVPKKPGTCQITMPKPPIWGKTCSFTCDPGHYLDLSTQTCQPCPIGTYSLGSGIRFDIWDSLPEDFTTYAETVGFSQYGYQTKVSNCDLSLWKANQHSVISNDDDCTSTLSYSVDLKQSGTVSFSYQYSDSNLIFHFFVQNNQCQTSQSRTTNVFLNLTGTEWKTWKATLNKGPNVLNWQTTGIMFNSTKKLSPVRIREIEITGVSYTTKCQKCPAGFIGPKPALARCLPCPINTYSTVGTDECVPCQTSNQYAPVGSDRCLPRPKCTEKDYFKTHSACDKKQMTNISYNWIQPKICLETLVGSVTLPPSGNKQPCSPCNPGLHPTNTECVPCPPNTFSNGSHPCQSCPASTSPHYGYFYLWWDFFPETMKSSCLSLPGNSCINDKGWEPLGDLVQTLSYHSVEAYHILLITLPGFMSELETNVFSRITFVFELLCEDDCRFYFMQDQKNEGTTVIKTWTGTQARQIYTYNIDVNDTAITYTWAFKKEVVSDVARIYVVNVTNVIGSSADLCSPCAAGRAQDSKCIPCPTGSILNVETHKCDQCVGNTIVNPDKSSCIECGPGTLASSDHFRCSSDCLYVSPITARQYNFHNLSTTTSVTTPPTFTSSGRQYNHVYNFSLCANQGRDIAECVDNVTYAHRGSFTQESMVRLTAMACRSTATPMMGPGNQQLSVHSQPTVIASHLISVSEQMNNSNQIFPKDNPKDPEDVVYHMGTPPSLDAINCPRGREIYIYLRCDPNVPDRPEHIQMPSTCPDGTCNGCDFHFLWRSMSACPTCTKDDYKEVVGGCQKGEVTTTYLWMHYPRKCRSGTSLPASTTKSCTDVMIYVEIGILAAVAVLVATCVLICMLYKKNKKLEYKYHRLMFNGVGDKNDSELPTADSCAISDSESEYDGDNDEVLFQKKKARLFGKKKVNNYESVSLKPATTGV